jgi:adenylyltransferase/sulfurtransferase
METMLATSPQQLAEWKKNGFEHQLIDIREQYEVETCNLGGTHIPMGEIVSRLSEIRRDIPVVIHCKSGRRSEAVVAHLNRLGFNNISSLEGGIMGWIDTIDSSLERY